MEPSTKKRKLAPKVNASPAANSQAAASQHVHELPPHYAVQETPVSERQDFESFARHLQDAAMLIQRQTERHQYSDVSVLLLSWEEDLAFRDDLAALAQVLQKQYNYGTQAWQIPTVANPSIKLGVQMASFLEHARSNHLLIIYYAGHSYMGSDGHLYWACNAQEDAARLKWDGVRCLFEDAQSDILLLLDSCAIPDPPLAGSHGIKQGIAAYAAEKGVRGEVGRSFTSNLINALQKLNTGRPFSIRQLYEETVTQGQLRLSQTAKPANGSGARAGLSQNQMPLLFTLTAGENQSLNLAPLPSRIGGQPQNGGEAPDSQSIRSREDQLIDPEMVTDLRFDEARILVCTTFVGDASPDMSFYNQWLQNTPPLASRIAVEGMFLGPPTMLLISMPHSIWNVVQHDKVCCFLGYVSSHNMIHLYEKLVGPAGVRPSAKQVEEGKILLEARELAASTPRLSRDSDHHEQIYHSSASRDLSIQGDRSDLLMQSSPPRQTIGLTSAKPKNEVEDSAEMQEAAEQLKALSHVRHRSDEAVSSGDHRRTTLPESAVDAARNKTGLSRGGADMIADDPNLLVDIKTAPSSRMKGPRRSMPKETRCSHCTHAPFKDSSSLRKHIAAAHTRPFPCAFSFAGCTSTFGSKNEWKRHIASQHLCLQYYRCSRCPQSAMEGKGNEFNRKDLFTQHLRRMHAPFQIKRAISQNDGQLQSQWEAEVKDMQQSCLVTRRQPPQRASCPKTDCRKEFDGPNAWDDWTEHVGRHMEKGEGPVLGVDEILTQWALDEGIIEPSGNGEYRLCAANGLLGSSQSSGLSPMLDRKNSTLMSFTDTSQMTDASQVEDTSMTDAMPVEQAAPTSQSTAV